MRVCVLGSGGFVGKNLLEKNKEWIGVPFDVLDLTQQKDVEVFFRNNTYDVVIHCAVIGGNRLVHDEAHVFYKNILMFENVVRVFKGTLIYFSSGAALRGNPPCDPYGLSKWIIDTRIQTIQNAFSLRMWGCYGPGELLTRFSAVCKKEGHVFIQKDRYFDFIDIEDVCSIVKEYVLGKRCEKEYNMVYPKKLRLSQWAEKFGATFEIGDTSELGEEYIALKTSCVNMI